MTLSCFYFSIGNINSLNIIYKTSALAHVFNPLSICPGAEWLDHMKILFNIPRIHDTVFLRSCAFFVFPPTHPHQQVTYVFIYQPSQ